jgi:hypothetical protein
MDQRVGMDVQKNAERPKQDITRLMAVPLLAGPKLFATPLLAALNAALDPVPVNISAIASPPSP